MIDDSEEVRAALESIAQEDFDALHYFLDLDFNPTTRIVSGSVTLTLRSGDPSLGRVVLDLLDNLAVSAVRRGSTNLALVHSGNILDITLDAPLASGQTTDVTVTYAGSPASVGLGSFGWNKYYWGGDGRMAWSLSEPEGARSWWPCKDRPDDKAEVEMWWTVPNTWIATGERPPDRERGPAAETKAVPMETDALAHDLPRLRGRDRL